MTNPDLPTWDEIDALVEGDPLALRDLAWRLRGEVDSLREDEVDSLWHRAVLRRHMAEHCLEDPTWRNLSEQEKQVLRAADEKVLAESGRRLPVGMRAA